MLVSAFLKKNIDFFFFPKKILEIYVLIVNERLKMFKHLNMWNFKKVIKCLNFISLVEVYCPKNVLILFYCFLSFFFLQNIAIN